MPSARRAIASAPPLAFASKDSSMKLPFSKSARAAQPSDPLDFDSANDWHAEKYSSALASRNRWLLAAMVAGALALLCIVALIGITPLKTVEPYVVKEDSKSGLVTVL